MSNDDTPVLSLVTDTFGEKEEKIEMHQDQLDIIKSLEAMLKDARAGDIETMCVASLHESEVKHGSLGNFADLENCTTMLGTLDFMMGSIREHMMGLVEEARDNG